MAAVVSSLLDDEAEGEETHIRTILQCAAILNCCSLLHRFVSHFLVVTA